MRTTKFDAIEEQLVVLLRTNGRRKNSDLARQLGVSEGAIRKKLKKLSRAGVLRIVAVADPQKLGYVIDVFAGLQVDPGQTPEVAERLSTLDVVRYVAVATGSYNILFEAMFQEHNQLLEFLTKTLPGIPGIVRSETWHLLKVVKRNYDWLNVEDRD